MAPLSIPSDEDLQVSSVHHPRHGPTEEKEDRKVKLRLFVIPSRTVPNNEYAALELQSNASPDQQQVPSTVPMHPHQNAISSKSFNELFVPAVEDS
jgi:hypothetical protein